MIKIKITHTKLINVYWKISTGRHFQNGCHNTAQIQHCPISTTFHMLVKWRWNRTMLNLCGIVAAILKMATGRNFSMSGINLGHHYPVSIFKMPTTIPQKIKLRICHNAKCSFKPVVSGLFGRLHNR
jgi:hypothetical protein